MTTIYKCDKCGAEFRNPRECRVHETGHFHGIDKIKYDLIHNQEEDICDYCEKSYYVYGCEQDCEYKDCKYSNNYKDFAPTKPLHNKRRSGI